MGLERLVNRGAGGDEREAIVTAVPQDLAAADGKGLLAVVDDGSVLSHRSQINHALVGGGGLDEPFRRECVTWVQHRLT